MEKWRFDIATQYYTGDTNRVDTNEIAGGDWDNSSIKSKAYVLILGIRYNF